MKYSRLFGGLIEEYEVEFDLDILIKLRCEIIDNCSKVIHCIKETTTPDYYNDVSHVRNFNSTSVGYFEYNDFYTKPDILYRVSYDYLEYPRLVYLIDELLNGNSWVIDEIKDNTISERVKKLIDKGLYDSVDSLLNGEDDIEVKLYTYYSLVLDCLYFKFLSKYEFDINAKDVSKMRIK